MKFFVKAMVSGFAFNLGAALFKKVQRKLGLADDTAPSTEVAKPDATDPNLVV